MRKAIPFFLLLFSFVGHILAIDMAGWQPVFPEKQTFSIPAGEKPVVHTLNIPAISPKAGHKVVMHFDARLLFQRQAGWNHCMGIKVNGIMLDENMPSGSLRIINRDVEQRFQKNKIESLWETQGTHSGILVYYSPATSKNVLPRALSNREEGFLYALDVTDVIRNEPNQVEFINLLPLKLADSPLQIKDLQFFHVPEQAIKQPAPRPFAPEGYIPLSNERVSFRIPAPEKGLNSFSFELPAVTPRKGYGVVLVYDGRMESKYSNGWNPWLSISLNGKPLASKNASEMPRLLRRGEILKTTLKDEQMWLKRGEHNCILTFFAAERHREIDKRVLSSRQERFRYCIDVTDLVNYQVIGADDRVEGGEPNRFTFFNHLPKHVADLAVLVKNLHLCYVPEKDILEQSGFKLTTFTPAPPKAKLTTSNAAISIGPAGGFSVEMGNETFYVESFFSYPARPEMKFHAFPVSNPAPGSWPVEVKQISPQEVVIYGRSAEYEIHRVLKVAGHRIAIVDKIRNLGTKDLGMAFYQAVAQSGKPLMKGSRLAGYSEAMQATYFGSANPTVFAAGSSGGLGLVAEDTISRGLIQLRKVGNTMRLGSAGMGLAPGTEKTLEWSVYPIAAGDYWDFINQVRRDWKVNYSLMGPFPLQDWAYLDAKAPYKALQPWFRYGEGAPLSDEQYRRKTEEQIAKHRSLNGNVRFLGMLELNLVMFDCSKVPWGEELKPRRGSRRQPGIHYGQPLSPRLTKLMEEAMPHLKDSMIRDENGNLLYDNFYPEAPYVSFMVQVEKGNSRYREVLEHIDILMDTFGFNGVYIDQFQPYTIGGYSEHKWDGHTVVLDEFGQITRKRYNYIITGASARATIIKHVLDKGGVIVINGQPTSREEQSLGVMAFQEMENDTLDFKAFLNSQPPELAWQAISHLGTPIALGARPNRYSKKDEGLRPKLTTKSIITALRNGLLHYHYHFNITLKPGPNHAVPQSPTICSHSRLRHFMKGGLKERNARLLHAPDAMRSVVKSPPRSFSLTKRGLNSRTRSQ